MLLRRLCKAVAHSVRHGAIRVYPRFKLRELFDQAIIARAHMDGRVKGQVGVGISHWIFGVRRFLAGRQPVLNGLRCLCGQPFGGQTAGQSFQIGGLFKEVLNLLG